MGDVKTSLNQGADKKKATVKVKKKVKNTADPNEYSLFDRIKKMQKRQKALDSVMGYDGTGTKRK